MIGRFTNQYRFLSNFWLCNIELDDGITYRSVEHAYQAMKTLDILCRLGIAACDTPGQARRMGHELDSLRDNWQTIKIPVMTMLVRKKFSDPVLRQALLDTDNEDLIENNVWRDSFWGVYKGKGENWLGKILMLVRYELKGEEHEHA